MAAKKSNPLPWVIGGGAAALAVLAIVLVRRSRAKAAELASQQLAPPAEPIEPMFVSSPSQSTVPQEPVLQRPATPAPAPTSPARTTTQAAPPRPSTRPAVLPVVQRQPALTAASATSAASIRILQHQLQYLGYDITAIDGRAGPELSRATLAFENDAGLDHFTSNLDLLIAVDQRYGHVFDPNNRGLA
jgi:hypothetical protein